MSDVTAWDDKVGRTELRSDRSSVPIASDFSGIITRRVAEPGPARGAAVTRPGGRRGVVIISLRSFTTERPRLANALLWVLAVLFTLLTFTWQDKTGPTYPFEGDLPTAKGTVHFKLVRSEIIGHDLAVVLLDPVPAGITGRVEYRRFKSHDDWTTVPLQRGAFRYERRGRIFPLSGLGATMPSLRERAGKYEYFVKIDDGSGEEISISGDRPVVARYKGDVPTVPLLSHVAVIFISMMFAARTVLAALVDAPYRWLLRLTILSFLLGAFVLGPVIQWYAFGVWWSGIPFGYDWTDNKVLVSIAAWLFAAWANRGTHRSRGAIYAAGVVTLLVYFIPHSIFGSEYDYRAGKGHGTAD